MSTPAHEPDQLEFAVRADRRAVVLFDGVPEPRGTVLDNATSRLVFPATAAVLDADEVVIWVPEERDDALQILVSPFEIDGRTEAAADRWRIYHGKEPSTRWLAGEPIALRLGPMVVAGDDVDLSNPLAAAEPALCKRFNAEPARLGALASAFDPRSTGSCVLVGVDAMGIDLRTRFDIVRVPFGERITDADAAGERIAELLERHAGDAA
ncbi:MAG: hypothetical protein AAGF47_08975 [Planctomycetota bacterium]